MTSQARHNGGVCPSGNTDAPSPHPLQLKNPSPSKRSFRPTSPTWIAAATACLAAFAIKISQNWLEASAIVPSELVWALDWTALLLCIIALFFVTRTRHPHVNNRQELVSTPPVEETGPNIAVPKPNDARLRLAHSLSHELRTPLNAVIGFTDLMQHQLHGNLGHPKYQEYCAHISTSSQNLLKAVDDLLALNLSGPLDINKRIPMPVAKALTAAWEENRLSDASASLDLHISGDDQQNVLADPEILSHALGNMLSAVAKHCAAGATVSATIDSDGKQTRISCSAEVDESRVVDTAPLLPLGIEVPERTRDTLTEAAAQVLIEKLDGKLTVHPHMHRNTLEFICQLPSAAPRPAEQRLAPGSGNAP